MRVSSTLRNITSMVAQFRLIRGWVETEAQSLPVWEVPIKVTGVVGDEVNAFRPE